MLKRKEKEKPKAGAEGDKNRKNVGFNDNVVEIDYPKNWVNAEDENAAIVIQRHVRAHVLRNSLKTRIGAEAAAQIEKLRLRRQQREQRSKGWSEDAVSAKRVDPHIQMSITTELFDLYRKEIEQLALNATIASEIALMGRLELPRVIIVSGRVRHSHALLEAVNKHSSILAYIDDNNSYEAFLTSLKSTLGTPEFQVVAHSICIIPDFADPACFSLMPSLLVSGAKVAKSAELQGFWKQLGELVSKTRDGAAIHILGDHSFKDSNDHACELLKSLSSLTGCPVYAPLEQSEQGLIQRNLYFDEDRYQEWRKTKNVKHFID